jgi:hypothetical protein
MRMHLISTQTRIKPRPNLPAAGDPLLAAEAISDTEIRLQVTLVDPLHAEFVEIERATAAEGPFANIATVQTDAVLTEFLYTDTALSAGTSYYYRARSRIDSTALRKYSEYTSVEAEVTDTTPVAASPVQPTGLSVTETARDADTVTYTLAWNAQGDADTFNVWIEPSIDGGYENGDSATPMANTASTSITGVAMDREIEYGETVLCVQGVNAAGPGAIARFPFYIPGNLTRPSIELTVGGGGNDVSVTVTRSGDDDSATHIEIERAPSSGIFANVATVLIGAAAPQHVDIDLPDETYTYRARVTSDGGSRVSGWSPVATIDIDTGSGSPTTATLLATMGPMDQATPRLQDYVWSGNGSPIASDNGDGTIVADPTGLLAPGTNVARIIYDKLPNSNTPDVNRSFEDALPFTINLGDKIAFELDVYFDVDDILRWGDQRKLTYFKSGTVKVNGVSQMASHWVLNSESKRWRVTIDNPLYGLTGPSGQKGGVRDRKIAGGAIGSFKINQWMNIYCELHMNTKTFDEFRAEALAGTSWSKGDGRMLLIVDGVTIMDVNDAIIMTDYTNTRQKPFNNFEFGKQYQATYNDDGTLMNATEQKAIAHTEYRYYRTADLWQLP